MSQLATMTPPILSLLKHLLKGEGGAAAEWQSRLAPDLDRGVGAPADFHPVQLRWAAVRGD